MRCIARPPFPFVCLLSVFDVIVTPGKFLNYVAWSPAIHSAAVHDKPALLELKISLVRDKQLGECLFQHHDHVCNVGLSMKIYNTNT